MRQKRNILWVLVMLSMCLVDVLFQGQMSRHIGVTRMHLKEFSYFKQYNDTEYFNDFRIAETWRDGLPFYQLTSAKDGVIVTIDKEQKHAWVMCDGKSVNFTITGFITTNASLYLADLTGDGEKELVYEEPMSGVTKDQGTCIVIRLKTMEIIEMQDFVDELLSKITVLPVSQAGENVVCKITDDNHHIYFGSIKGQLDAIQDHVVKESNYCAVEYRNAEQKLRVYTCFTLSNCEEGGFLGDISTDYCYNQQSNCFELDNTYEVAVWNPIKNS